MTTSELGPRSEYTVTVTEAAQMFAVSADTIRRWEREGKLVGRRTLGQHRRFRLADLEALAK